MPELHLAHEYQLPNYEGLVLRQDSPADAAEVMLNLLDDRYVTSILHKASRVAVAAWSADGEGKGHYGELLLELPGIARETLAVAHAVFATGEAPPDPEDIPDSEPTALLIDWDELPDDARENVLLNAVHIGFQMRINAGTHPYALAYALLKQLPAEAQGALVSEMMTQYVRQYHSSRQNRN